MPVLQTTDQTSQISLPHVCSLDSGFAGHFIFVGRRIGSPFISDISFC
jgi:hypothetical protein